MNYEFHPEAAHELYEAALVYALTPDLIYIVAVAHGHREPEYWRSRVQDR